DVALSGIEALNILENQAYDLILLDNRMPGMTGVDFLKIFSTSRFRKNTKVLLVTAEIRKNIELDINKANISIDGILSKPFNISGLLSAISDVL
ncbi:MAG: response regulator, partial [Rhodospirillaceae bacterium]